MIRLTIMMGLMLLIQSSGYAQQLTLLDDKSTGQDEAVKTNEFDNEELEDEASSIPSLNDSDYQEMNDYIVKEDKKMKEIKLLSLDLQKTDIELKKKELEQKISKLSNGQSMMPSSDQKDEQEERDTKALKLVSVFITDTKRTAIISNQGQHRQVEEGDMVDKMKVKQILNSKVIFELSNHQMWELSF